MSTFEEIDRKYEGKLIKGHDKGLGYYDYDELCKLRRQLADMGTNNPKVRELYNKIDELVVLLVNEGAASKFSKENKEYIMSHAILLPLALTDCSSWVERSDKSIFDIKFPKSKDGKVKPGIIVKDLSNGYLPEGSRTDSRQENDIIEYLKMMHGFRKNDSLELLCRVFGFEIPNKSVFSWKKVQRVADSYHDVFNYEKLPKLIEASYKAVKHLGIYKEKSIKDIYDERLATVERVKSLVYDPHFEHKFPDNVILKK